MACRVHADVSPRDPAGGWEEYELYSVAARLMLCPQASIYDVAMFAARQTAIALLNAASKAGVSPEQWEVIRAAAARVATDGVKDPATDAGLLKWNADQAAFQAGVRSREPELRRLREAIDDIHGVLGSVKEAR